MIDAGVALIGMVWCFAIGAFAAWWLCYLWWHGGGGGPDPSDPPPATPTGPRSGLTDEERERLRYDALKTRRVLDVHDYLN